jgi:hypothetical protein
MSHPTSPSEQRKPSRHAILYVPGAGQHVFEQSAGLVAERIARAIERRIGDRKNCGFRITVSKNLNLLVSNTFDRASIEVRDQELADNDWTSVVDVYELKYLDTFSGWFSNLPPLRQAVCGCWILLRAVGKFCVGHLHSTFEGPRGADGDGDDCRSAGNDYLQILLYNLKLIGIFLVAILFWLVLALLAVVGIPTLLGADLQSLFTGVFHYLGFSEACLNYLRLSGTALILFVVPTYFAIIRNLEALGKLAAEFFCVMDYAHSHYRYLSVLHAIRDATVLLRVLGAREVDLLTLSLGAILGYDAWYPRQSATGRPEIPQRDGARLDHWITLGFPVQMMRWQYPNYFRSRSDSHVPVGTHFNIWIKDDPIGSRITGLLGFADVPSGSLRQWPFEPSSKRYRPRRGFNWRMNNHCLYWDDRDPGACTCFDSLLKEGWLYDVVRDVKCNKAPATDPPGRYY